MNQSTILLLRYLRTRLARETDRAERKAIKRAIYIVTERVLAG